MNERIRELAEQQAGSILMDLLMPDSGMPERIKWNIGCTTEHLEKFAELIVQECLEVVEKQLGGGNGDGVEWDRAIDFTYEDMKKHFGVEE